VAVVEHLVAVAGVDIEKESYDGWPPLWHAIYANNVPAVELLLRAGANPNRICGNREGRTALEFALHLQRHSTLSAIAKAGGRWSPHAKIYLFGPEAKVLVPYIKRPLVVFCTGLADPQSPVSLLAGFAFITAFICGQARQRIEFPRQSEPPELQ
jgi:hypothetical protein